MSFIIDKHLNDLAQIGTQFWRICCNKERPSVPIDGQDRTDRVPDFLGNDLSALQRAAIITIILFIVFLFSVPAVIVGSVALANNTTCASTAARWLIIYGCIGVAEATILITFVILKATCCHTKDQCVIQYVLRIAISILIIGPCIQIIYGIFAILNAQNMSSKCSDGIYFYAVALFSILCFCIFIYGCLCSFLYWRSCCKQQPIVYDNKVIHL